MSKCKVYIESIVTQRSLKIPAHKPLTAWNHPVTFYLIHPPKSITTFPPLTESSRRVMQVIYGTYVEHMPCHELNGVGKISQT